MNASYKIVLLGAFVVFAAVVSYYVFSGGDGPEDNPLEDDYAQQDPMSEPPVEPTSEPPTEPEPRPVLEEVAAPVEPAEPAEPVAEVEPVVEEETIGTSPDELPEAPVIASLDGEDQRPVRGNPQPVSEEPQSDPATPGEDPSDEAPASPTEDIAGPADGPRRAPGLDPADPVDEPTEPGTEPEADPDPRPVPPAPGTIPRNYTVQEGDTFASIAEAFYGDESAWYNIAQANPSIDPKRLQIGQVIVLPNRDDAVREREEVQPPAPGTDAVSAVRPGDNLSKIAKKVYGDAEKWDLIYARNRNLIGPRPNDLKVGMELVIPQAYDGAE